MCGENEPKKPRYFIRGLCTDDVWCYAGDSSEHVSKNLGSWIGTELELLENDGAETEVSIRRSDMTDAEVEALPDL